MFRRILERGIVMKRWTCVLHGEEFDIKCSQCDDKGRGGSKLPETPINPVIKEKEKELQLV
jgi:hypothetical protein